MSDNTNRNNLAKLVAGSMMAHFENGIECFYEFFPTDEGEIDGISEEDIENAGQWCSDNISDMYDNNDVECVAMREEVIEHLRKMLELPSK